MSSCSFSVFTAALSCCLCGSAWSLTPYEAWVMAIAHDPVYQKAQTDYAAIQENIGISRSALFPTIAAEHRHAPQNARSVTVRSPGVRDLTFKRHYRTDSSSLILNQPLFDLSRWNQFKQSEAEAKAAQYSFMRAAQDLIIRVFGAYIETLHAKDQLRIARLQYDVYAEELKRNRSAFAIGDATRTDVSETEALFLAAEVSVEDANDALQMAMQKLSQITGAKISSVDLIASIKTNYAGQREKLRSLDYWKALALTNNRQLLQARESIHEARLARKKVRSEFAPTVSLVAEHTRNTPWTDETLDQRYRTTSISIMVSVPLYSGGKTTAAVQQANQQIESRVHEAEVITHDIMINIVKNYRLLSSGTTRIRARQRAVQAAQTALTGNRVAVIVGDRVNSDILNATQRLYTARSELAGAIYDDLKAIIDLKYYAGVLSPTDIMDISLLFEG